MLYLDDPIGNEVPLAYDEGYSAYYFSATLDDNPYYGDQRIHWYHGWNDAHMTDVKKTIVTFSVED